MLADPSIAAFWKKKPVINPWLRAYGQDSQLSNCSLTSLLSISIFKHLKACNFARKPTNFSIIRPLHSSLNIPGTFLFKPVYSRGVTFLKV